MNKRPEPTARVITLSDGTFSVSLYDKIGHIRDIICKSRAEVRRIVYMHTGRAWLGKETK